VRIIRVRADVEKPSNGLPNFFEKRSQAEDRLHRMGQIERVLVQHLMLEGSFDGRMAGSVTAMIERATG
jgi:hypothetical protein